MERDGQDCEYNRNLRPLSDWPTIISPSSPKEKLEKAASEEGAIRERGSLWDKEQKKGPSEMWNSIFLLGGGKFDYVCSLFANSYLRTRGEMSRKSNFGTEKQKPIRTHPALATRGNTNQSQTCSRRIVVSDTSFFFALNKFYYFSTTIHCAQKGIWIRRGKKSKTPCSTCFPS